MTGSRPAVIISGQPIRKSPEFKPGQALPHLVENGDPALEQCSTTDSWLNTPGVAIKEPHAERLLQIGNRL
jgi:hypothetical protein